MEIITLKTLLIRNTGFQVLAHVISLLLGLATTTILSRYLGVERFGQFNYIFAFFIFFLSISDFGVNVVVVREISKQRERAAEIIGSMLSLKLVFSGGSVLAAWTVIWLLEFSAELRSALLLYALILPLTAAQLPAVIFQALLKLEYPSLIGIGSRTLSFLLTVGAAWLGYDLVGLIAALILSELATAALLLTYSRSFVRPVWSCNPRLWREVLRSSVPLGVMGLLVASINRVDFLMLERMTDLHQVGLYAAAYKVTNLLETFPLMVMGTIYPLMSRYAAEDVEKLRELYRNSVIGLGAVALPLGIGTTFFAPAIITILFGEAFAGAERALAVLVWSTVFLYVAINGGNLLISMGKEKVNLWLNAVGAGLNIALNLWLIPGMGYVGAALATTMTYLFILIGMAVGSHMALYSTPLAAGLARVKDAQV